MAYIRSMSLLACILSLVSVAMPFPAFAEDAEPASVSETPAPQSAPVQATAPPEARSLEAAAALMRQQRADEAVKMLEALIRDQPDDARIYHLLGVAELFRKHYPAGIAALRRAAELAPDDVGIRLDLAAGHEGAGETAEAEAIYRSLLEVPGTRIEATFRLASLHAGAGRAAEAIDGFERVVAARQEAPSRAAEAAARLNPLYAQVAREHVVALERGDPDAFTRAMSFGTGLVGKNRLDDAQLIFEAVARIHPDRAPGYYWLSRVQITRGDLQTGVLNLERAAERAPDNFRLRIELGRAYETVERLDRAEQTYSEVIERAQDPRVVQDARIQLGLLRARRLFAAQDWGAALPLLEELLSQAPGDARILEMKAEALDNLGRSAEAERIYAGLIERTPDNVGLLTRVAAAHERRGQQASARVLYGRILALGTTGEPARLAHDRLGLGRGIDLLRQDRVAEALAVFESILAVAPDSPAANLGAGMAYRRLQRYDEAEAALRKVLANGQGGLAPWIELGQVYEEAGRTAEAGEVFEEVARFARTPEEQQLLRERLGAIYDQEVERTSTAYARGTVDVSAVVALGQRLVQRGFNEHAVKLLESAVARTPEDARLQFWLGNAYIALGNPERGLRLLERAAELAPGDTKLLLALADAHAEAGRLEDAELSYAALIRQAPDEGERRRAERSLGLVRAQMAQNDRNYSGALAEYEKLLRDAPDDPQLLLGQARLLMALGRESEADRIMARLLEIAPDNIGVRLGLAQIYRVRGRMEDAERQYRDLLAVNPALVAVRFELARLYQDTGRWEEALREYSLILEKTQGTAQAAQVGEVMGPLVQSLLDQGAQLIAQRQLDAAEDHFKRLHAALPKNTQALYMLSEVHREQGRHDLQIERMEQAVALAPSNVPMQRRLAFAFADAGIQDRAEQAFDQLLRDFPYDSEVRYRRAELYAARGDEALARNEYEQILLLTPTREWRARALDRLGLERARAFQAQGEVDRALATIHEVLALAPDDPIVYTALAQAYRQAGRLAEAEAAYRSVLEADHGDRDARLELARIYSADIGREAETVKAYHDLATESVVTIQSVDARRELDEWLQRRAEREIERIRGERDLAVVETRLLPLGIESFELGATTVARMLFEHLVRTAPESAASHYWLGRVTAAQGDHAGSLVFMRRSTELAPGNPEYLLWLGREYAELKVYRQAEQSMEQSLAIDSDNVEAYFDLGELYQRSGDDARAELQFARALEHARDDAQVTRALRSLGLHADPDRLGTSQLGQATRVFDELISTPPRSIAARYYIATVYLRAQRYGPAEAIYRAVRATEPGHVRATLKLAQLFAETGRIDDAIALYGEVIARGDPQLSQQAQQAQTALLVGQARLQIGLLERGEGDIRVARRLARALLERGQPEPTAALMRAALPRGGAEVSEVQYLLGRALVDLGQFDTGLAAMERSVALAPPDLAVTLRQHLAIAYERAGRTDDAVRVHRALYAQATDPQLRQQARVRLALVRGAQLAKAENYQGALREYDEALTIAPNEVLLITERGRMLSLLGREAEADQAFEQVLRIAPQNTTVRLRLVEVYHSRGDTTKYLPHAAVILQIDPFGAEARSVRTLLGFDRGRELLQVGAVAEAVDEFQRLLDVAPGDPLARVELADAQIRQRKMAEADRLLIGVIRDYPDYQEAYIVRGSLLLRLDQRDDAIQQYEHALALGGNTAAGAQAMQELNRLYSQRVQELATAGQEETAILELARQLETMPDNAAARNNLIIIYSRKQRYPEALEQLEELIRLQPENATAYGQQGSLLAVLQRHFDSVEAYARAISLERDERTANGYVLELLVSLVRYQVNEGQPFAAIRDLSMLNERGLGDERTYAMLGTLYRQQNRYDEAGRAFRDAIRLAPNNTLTRFNLADTYEQTYDYDLALLQYRQVLRTSQPGSRVWEEARRRAELWSNRLALFTSQLSYSTTIGDSTIKEQDINSTGALNTDFSSQLFYNLATNFWPTNTLNLRVDTGLSYISNHSTGRDNFFPRVGVAGNLNLQKQFYTASFHASDIRDLMLDTYEGTSYVANLSGGLRFSDSPLEVFRGLTRKKRRETGERSIERAQQQAPRGADSMADNFRLRSSLQEYYRQRQPAVTIPALAEPANGVSAAGRRGEPGRIFDDGGIPSAPAASATETGQELEEINARRVFEREEAIRSAVEATMEQYRAGRAHMRQGRPEAALAAFDIILERVPDDPLTLLNVAMVYQQQGRYTEAERVYLEARAADPENRELSAHLAMFYEQTGQIDRAIAVVKEMIDDAPHETEREATRARLRALYRRQADIALGFLSPPLPEVNREARAAREEQATIAVVHRAAAGLLEAGDPAAAAAILDTLLERDPADAEGHHLRADVHLALGQPAEAVPHAQLSVSQGQDQPRYLLTLARALEAAGEHEQADAAYRSLADLAVEEPLAAVAGYELALNRAARLEAAGAREIYLELLENRDEDAALHLLAAQSAVRLGRIDEAKDHYLRAIELRPDDIGPRLALADLYRRQGDGSNADAQLTEAMARATTEAEREQIRDRLGLADALDAIQRNRTTRAMEALRRMQAVLTDDALVLLNIGVVHQMRGQIPEAEAAFQRVLDADPRNLTARLRLGLLYSETGRIDRAIPVLERVASEGAGIPVGDRALAGLQGLEERRLSSLAGGRIEETLPVNQTLSGRLFFNDASLPAPSIAETYSYGFSLSYSYRSVNRGDWVANYTFGIRDYEHPLGSDYAYWWHDLGLTYRSLIPNLGRLFGPSDSIPGLSGVVSLGYESREYTYVDTYALNALGEITRRIQRTTSVNLGLQYQPPNYSQISFFGTYTRGWSRANLPVGITFSPGGIPVAFQSAGLGSFDPNYFNLGMSFQF